MTRLHTYSAHAAHNDQDTGCVFCYGRLAYLNSRDLEDNPHPQPPHGSHAQPRRPARLVPMAVGMGIRTSRPTGDAAMTRPPTLGCAACGRNLGEHDGHVLLGYPDVHTLRLLCLPCTETRELHGWFYADCTEQWHDLYDHPTCLASRAAAAHLLGLWHGTDDLAVLHT